MILTLGGLDLVDGTPVIDIKPYLPFAEALPDARAGYAREAPEAAISVFFTDEIAKALPSLEKRYPRLASLFVKCSPRIRVRLIVKRKKPARATPSGCLISTSAGA